MNLRRLRPGVPATPPRVLQPEELEQLSPDAVARLMEFVRARPFMVNLDQRTERRLDEFMADHNATLALSAEDELHGAEGLEIALMMCVERGLEAFATDRTGGGPVKIEHPLTFEVEPRRRHGDDEVGLLGAAVKVSGAMAIHQDLQPGAVLMVRVCDADGQLVAQCEAEVTGVGFRQIKHKGQVIGMERVHTSKVEG